MTMSTRGWMAAILVSALALAGCSGSKPVAEGALAEAADAGPGKTLFDRMETLCDQAFAGRVVINEPADPDPAYQHTPILGVRCLGPYKILAVSFGDDRSRSMVLSRDQRGVLGLRHLHNHRDGSRQELTEYGGYAHLGRSSPERVVFPATAESVAKFENLGLTSRMDSVWTLSLDEGRQLVYDAEASGWHLQLVFDLDETVPAPPLPWVEAPVE